MLVLIAFTTPLATLSATALGRPSYHNPINDDLQQRLQHYPEPGEQDNR